MPILHYAKVNINSNILDVYKKKEKIPKILDKLFTSFNDRTEYNQIETRKIEDENGNVELIRVEEIFNFSNLDKYEDNTKKYITGKLVRRVPIHTEEFDSRTRKPEKVVYDKNATSIFFYFDFNTEIITFCQRTRFGYAQFIKAFNNIIDKFTNVGFEIFLIKDPFKIDERIKRAHRITKIQATVVPPNVNEEALEDFYDRNTKEMEEARITKRTSIFEVHKKSDYGINVEAKIVREALNVNKAYINFGAGYGKLEVEGFNKDGSKFHYDSDEESPYQTIIDKNTKNNELEFINASQKGIVILQTQKTIEKYKED